MGKIKSGFFEKNVIFTKKTGCAPQKVAGDFVWILRLPAKLKPVPNPNWPAFFWQFYFFGSWDICWITGFLEKCGQIIAFSTGGQNGILDTPVY